MRHPTQPPTQPQTGQFVRGAHAQGAIFTRASAYGVTAPNGLIKKVGVCALEKSATSSHEPRLRALPHTLRRASVPSIMTAFHFSRGRHMTPDDGSLLPDHDW